MKKYEYMKLIFAGRDTDIEKLNALAAQGWHVVLHHAQSITTFLLLEREKVA